MVRLYNSGGFQEYSVEQLIDFARREGLLLIPASIVSLRILERKFMSNRGNALSGVVSLSRNLETGLNIGGNPIGTGYKNYLAFLEEMNCKKTFGLYRLNSLVGSSVAGLFCGDIQRGFLSHEGINELSKHLK